MDDYQYFLHQAGEFHGSTCVGIALGTRITLAALRCLGLDPHENNRKRTIAIVEIDRCMADAVQAITGCTPGRRSLKLVDYGKFALTLLDQATSRAVRGTVTRVFSSGNDRDGVLREIASIPDAELVTLQPVRLFIPENDLPGPARESVFCAACGERVVDGRHVTRGGTVYCKGCSGDSYYREEPAR